MFDQDEDAILSTAEWALVDEHIRLEMGQGRSGSAGQGMNMPGPG